MTEVKEVPTVEPEVNRIDGQIIQLVGEYVPEVAGKEVLLLHRRGPHLSELLEIRTLNPEYKETGNAFIEGDIPEILNIFYCSVELQENESVQKNINKLLEEAAYRYFLKNSPTQATKETENEVEDKKI